MAVHGPTETREAVVDGALAGVIAGIALALFLTTMNVANGQDLWAGAKLAGLPFLGERALEPGFAFGPILVGVLSHLAVSIGWGILFAILLYGFGSAITVASSVVWGICVWLGMHYVVLPLAGAEQVTAMVTPAMAIFEHVAFGVALGLSLIVVRRARHPVTLITGHQVPMGSRVG